jgi:hypothetical protein
MNEKGAYRTAPATWGLLIMKLFLLVANLQIKPKSKSSQTKNLERLYNWVVVCGCRRRPRS